MLRIGLKFPVNGLNLNRIKKNGCEKLYLTARSYETKTKPKCDDRLLKDVILTSRLSSGYRYSTESKSEKSRGGSTGTLVTIGAVTIGAIGILTYAKSNYEFRETLESWIPGTDRAIKIIFQEEATFLESIISFFESLKNKIWNLIFGDTSQLPKPAPRPAFVPTLTSKQPEPEKPKPEIRLSKDQGDKIDIVAEGPSSDEKVTSVLLDLEQYGGQLATSAIAAFQEAACAVQDFNKDVISVVESSDSSVGDQVWERLKAAQEKRKEAIKEAETKANEAVETLKTLRVSIDDPKVEASIAQKTIARRNMNKILADLDEAKKKFDEEVAQADITEKYWKNVRTAREKFHEELQILFPNININEKKLSVNDEAFDLFVLHMYHKVAYLHKELEKMQTIADSKINNALKSSSDETKLEEAIFVEVTKQKRELQEEFDKRLLQERQSQDVELRKQLKLQTLVYQDHLQETIAAKDREAQRMVNRVLSEYKENESSKSKEQLALVIGKLRGLDEALKIRLDAEKDASEAQLVWGACQALVRAVKAAPPGTRPEDSLRPLEPEIKAIVKAAPKDDPFVTTAIGGIPKEATKRGVYPEDALRERFLKVEKMARKLALVPEEGASLPIYLLSYLQSFLLITAANPIPKYELDDQPIDTESLNTYDILQRARYYMDRGELKMALRYMNLLEGAPRSVARDWMNEARILLETYQAIESLVAYAGANSLVFMGGGDGKEK